MILSFLTRKLLELLANINTTSRIDPKVSNETHGYLTFFGDNRFDETSLSPSGASIGV